MLNPSDKTDDIGDLYIEDGVIKEKGPGYAKYQTGYRQPRPGAVCD